MNRSFFSSFAWLSLLCLFPACDGNVSSGGGGSGDTGGTSTGGSAGDGVTVLFVDSYELDGVTGERPQDLSRVASITALVANGDKYDSYPGQLFQDGHAEIPGVPEGPYVLERRFEPSADIPEFPTVTRYLATSERTLDLGHNHVGRADAAPLDQQADLRVKGALSSPWADPEGDPLSSATDRLEIYSREAGAYGLALDMGNGEAPFGGDTSVDWGFDALLAFDSLGWSPVAIDQSKGDKAVVVRERNDALFPDPALAPDVGWATATYDHVVDAQAVTQLTVKPGTEALAEGSFSPAASSVSFDFVYEQAATQPLSDALGAPTDTLLSFSLYLEPSKTAPSYSASPYLNNLTVFGVGAPANPTCYPDDMGVCDAGLCPNGCDESLLPAKLSDLSRTFDDQNPFNPEATHYAYFQMSFGRRVPNPGDGGTARLITLYSRSGKAEALTGKSLAPQMGLIQNPKVGGAPCDFDDVLTGVGTGPTLSWDPPSSGDPQYYTVTLRDENNLVTDQGNLLASAVSVASFRTTDTHVTFPTGALVAGHYYTFRVGAFHEGTAPDAAAPERWKSFDSAGSVRSTGLFAP